MVFIESKYVMRLRDLYWIFAINFLIFVLIEYFPFNKFPSIFFDSIKITSVITSFFVLLSTFIHFLFKPLNYYKIKNVISKWGGDQVYSIEGWDNFYSEEFVSILKRISNQKKKSESFYFLKPKEEITDSSNFGNYLMILITLLLSSDGIKYYEPISIYIYFFFILICIIYCISIIIWDIRKNKLKKIITLLHIITIYLLFIFAKPIYVKSYGDKILGSYFEQYDYRTKYYVIVFSKGKAFKLPADIHVYHQDISSYSYGDYEIMKWIFLERLYLPDGKYVDFHDCDLKMYEYKNWDDQNGKSWRIMLTEMKVESLNGL